MKQKLLARIGALEVVTTRYVPPIIRIIPVSPDGTEGPAYILTKQGAVLEAELVATSAKGAPPDPQSPEWSSSRPAVAGRRDK